MQNEEELRERLHRLGEATQVSPRHDQAILDLARKTARKIAERRAPPARRRDWWKPPLALAAGLLIGMVATREIDLNLSRTADSSRGPSTLLLPIGAIRGKPASSIPVEQANPDDWYRYIQELIAAGEAQEAERHLRRFNELHPDYAYQP